MRRWRNKYREYQVVHIGPDLVLVSGEPTCYTVYAVGWEKARRIAKRIRKKGFDPSPRVKFNYCKYQRWRRQKYRERKGFDECLIPL
jgi:hypothetical protein